MFEVIVVRILVLPLLTVIVSQDDEASDWKCVIVGVDVLESVRRAEIIGKASG